MSGRKKRFSDPHRLMAVICIVFYSALGLLALAWALLALFPALGETPVPLVMLVCALAAILAASILSAFVRCPCCGAWPRPSAPARSATAPTAAPSPGR